MPGVQSLSRMNFASKKFPASCFVSFLSFPQENIALAHYVCFSMLQKKWHFYTKSSFFRKENMFWVIREVSLVKKQGSLSKGNHLHS